MDPLELRVIRTRERLTQTALAAKIGRNQSYLSSLERGKIQATQDDLKKIARALRVPVESLCGREVHNGNQ